MCPLSEIDSSRNMSDKYALKPRKKKKRQIKERQAYRNVESIQS